MGAAYFLCRDGASSGVSGSQSGGPRGLGSGSSPVRVSGRAAGSVLVALVALGRAAGSASAVGLGRGLVPRPEPGRLTGPEPGSVLLVGPVVLVRLLESGVGPR